MAFSNKYITIEGVKYPLFTSRADVARTDNTETTYATISKKNTDGTVTVYYLRMMYCSETTNNLDISGNGNFSHILPSALNYSNTVTLTRGTSKFTNGSAIRYLSTTSTPTGTTYDCDCKIVSGECNCKSTSTVNVCDCSTTTFKYTVNAIQCNCFLVNSSINLPYWNNCNNIYSVSGGNCHCSTANYYIPNSAVCSTVPTATECNLPSPYTYTVAAPTGTYYASTTSSFTYYINGTSKTYSPKYLTSNAASNTTLENKISNFNCNCASSMYNKLYPSWTSGECNCRSTAYYNCYNSTSYINSNRDSTSIATITGHCNCNCETNCLQNNTYFDNCIKLTPGLTYVNKPSSYTLGTRIYDCHCNVNSPTNCITRTNCISNCGSNTTYTNSYTYTHVNCNCKAYISGTSNYCTYKNCNSVTVCGNYTYYSSSGSVSTKTYPNCSVTNCYDKDKHVLYINCPANCYTANTTDYSYTECIGSELSSKYYFRNAVTSITKSDFGWGNSDCYSTYLAYLTWRYSYGDCNCYNTNSVVGYNCSSNNKISPTIERVTTVECTRSSNTFEVCHCNTLKSDINVSGNVDCNCQVYGDSPYWDSSKGNIVTANQVMSYDTYKNYINTGIECNTEYTSTSSPECNCNEGAKYRWVAVSPSTYQNLDPSAWSSNGINVNRTNGTNTFNCQCAYTRNLKKGTVTYYVGDKNINFKFDMKPGSLIKPK